MRHPTASPRPASPPDLRTWPLAGLQPNPQNPRGAIAPEEVAELARSIATHGILEPLLVTPDGTIVAGHRRFAACALAGGIAEVPVTVRTLSRTEQLELMLAENVQREDLSPVQEARGYRRLLDDGSSAADVARRVGVPASRVSARLVLLALEPSVQDAFHRRQLPITLAPVLADVHDPAQQRRLAAIAVRRRLSVPQLRRIADRGARRRPAGPGRASRPAGRAPVRRSPARRASGAGRSRTASAAARGRTWAGAPRAALSCRW